MEPIFTSPHKALGLGVVLSAVLAVIWLATTGSDFLGALSFFLRWGHVLGGIVWVGLVWYVNFVQLPAIYALDDAGRAVLGKSIMPGVAFSFRMASHLSLLTGVALLLTSGHLLPSLVYGSGVFVPGARSAMLWTGALGGIAMWVFVHYLIWPNLQVMSGAKPGDDAAKGRARLKVRTYARANLILSIPVTFAMVAAAHL